MSIFTPLNPKARHSLIPTVITQDISEELIDESPKDDIADQNKLLIVPRVVDPEPKAKPKISNSQLLKPMATSVSKLSVLNPSYGTSHNSLASGISGVLSGISTNYHQPIAFKPFKYAEELQCQICLSLLKDPRILDCLHSFCLQCVWLIWMVSIMDQIIGEILVVMLVNLSLVRYFHETLMHFLC